MVTVRLPTARTQREDTAQPYCSDGNYTTTHANKTINKLQQPEKDHAKNNRILRTHHHNPRPPHILTRALDKSRCSARRVFPGVFRRSFVMTTVGSLTVVLHATDPSDLGRKVRSVATRSANHR